MLGFSQNVKFEGTVQDTLKKPLEMANVMAINVDTKGMDGYSITNDKGKFSISLKANTTYSVKVSFIGFKSRELTIVTTNEDITKTIELKEGDIELEGVEIVQEMPVSIVGDKIVYNADSFTSGTERKLEDVLKKLPGVEVSKDGTVQVEGKNVQKLMVDGKEFFDGDTKLGVKNIPADAIDKIEVLRNYNEVDALKGVENNQENVAMNIKLKKGKKNFWFGDISAAAGVGKQTSRYLVNPKLFYYSPKYSINILSNFNNIGEPSLNSQDNFRFNGGFRNLTRKGGSSLNVASNENGIQGLRDDQAKEITTKFGATNFTYNPTKAWSLSGYALFSSALNEIETQSDQTILVSGARTITKQNNLQRNEFGIGKFSTMYKPNSNFQLDYDLLTRLTNQSELNTNERTAIVNNTSNFENISTTRQQKPFSFNQNLSMFYTLNEKHIFALESQHLYQDEDPFYNANLRTQPFTLNGYTAGQNRNSIDQTRFLKTNKADSKLDYYYMFTKKSNINVTLGNTYSYQNFNTNLFQNLDNGVRNPLLAPENNNRTTFSFIDTYLGLHYRLLTGKLTITPGVSFHNYDTNVSQLGEELRQSFQQILPDFNFLWQIKKSETLTYDFRISNNFVDITRRARGSIFNGINSLSQGNPEIENATVQGHRLIYSKYNLFNFETIRGILTYNRSMDAIKTNAIFNGINQISRPINSPFIDENLRATGNYGRSFTRDYKASLGVIIDWSKFYNQQNSVFAVAESFNQNYNISASTNYKALPNLEVGYSVGIQKFNQNPAFYNERPFAKLDYFFLNGFSFVTEYEYNHFYNADRSADNEFEFLSASLAYRKKDNPWEFVIRATNILNTTSINDANFNQFVISTSQYTVLPRFVTLNFKYNL